MLSAPESVEVPLTRGYKAHVDVMDAEAVSRHSWHVARRGYAVYAVAYIGDRLVYMHRFLLAVTRGVEIDHIDGDGLNNRRANLRVATHAENAWNWQRVRGMSRYQGVSKTRNGGWCASITRNGKNLRLGTFDSEEVAALAYDLAAVLRGPRARLNIGVTKETAAIVAAARRPSKRLGYRSLACPAGHPRDVYGGADYQCRECRRLRTRRRRATESAEQRQHRLATASAYRMRQRTLDPRECRAMEDDGCAS
jgi:hypothetical protein